MRIEVSPDELRRLLGQPALLPLYETLALAFERWLMALVSRSLTESGTNVGGACACDGRRRWSDNGVGRGRPEWQKGTLRG